VGDLEDFGTGRFGGLRRVDVEKKKEKCTHEINSERRYIWLLTP
jgi:hypothetical protein